MEFGSGAVNSPYNLATVRRTEDRSDPGHVFPRSIGERKREKTVQCQRVGVDADCHALSSTAWQVHRSTSTSFPRNVALTCSGKKKDRLPPGVVNVTLKSSLFV